MTQIKYDLLGDLLFTAAKDSTPCVWFTHNGERLGTYDGHNGTVWCLDVDYRTQGLLTGSADNSFKLWDVETGACNTTIATNSPVRTCNYSYDASQFFISTEKAMGYKCEIHIYDVARVKQEGAAAKPKLIVKVDEDHSLVKVTSALWGPLDTTIVSGHQDGSFHRWDVNTGKILGSSKDLHKNQINDMQYSKDLSMIIAASKDNTASLFDTETFNPLKRYTTDRPVNSAAISPLKEHVVLGGGQEAMSVTTTHGKAGKFDARFYHMVFEEELGRVKGHFGPINTVAFHPDGRSYSSGGEDGYVRIHNFDLSYFEFEFEH